MNDNTAPGGGESKANDALDISVKVYPVKEPKSNLLAYVSVTLGGCFAVNDIRVMNSEKGPFMAMPSKKGKDGQYHDSCFPTTAAMRKNLNEAVMGEFARVTQKESVRGAIQNGQKEASARPVPEYQKAARRTAGAR